ncbi:MAG: 4Fe-4S dicluster domain-containing protein [Thermodesulfobacteriota bacterium]
MSLKAEIVDQVRAAGVVGAGGAGFPTHVKLEAQVERVLANGASCEPLLSSDPYLMERRAETVVKGLKAVMTATGASAGTICLKGKHQEALAAVSRAADQAGVSVFELGDFYPAGDEQVLVYEVMGRVVPEGGLPLQVGAVVSNVESLINVAQALEGRPVTDRWLTVAGEVARPLIARVPLGVSVGEVIALAGGALRRDFLVVLGGPMMGRVTGDLGTPVTKTTSGIIVLPPEHNVVAVKVRDPERVRYVTRVACCQCSRCTDLCPRNLLGHSLAPHLIMRSLSAPRGPAREAWPDALICSECGLCEKFACPMMISPREVNAQLKQELLAGGTKRAPGRTEYRPSPFRALRRVPTQRLVQRLGLVRYDVHPEFAEPSAPPAQVALPLKQHLGAPAQPVVKAGDRVKRGDLVGEIPPRALGARVHASIDGKVVAVTDHVIIRG